MKTINLLLFFFLFSNFLFAQNDSVIHPRHKIFITGSYDLSRHWSFQDKPLQPQSLISPEPKTNSTGWSYTLLYQRKLGREEFLGSGIIISKFTFDYFRDQLGPDPRSHPWPTTPWDIVDYYYSDYSTLLLQVPVSIQ